MKHILLIALAAVLVTSAHAGISVTLEPNSIGPGESAQLTVTGDSDAGVELPKIAGLKFTPVGQSSQFQSINGAVSMSVSRLYAVTPLKPGNYTIPVCNSWPVTLHVSNTGTAPARSLPAPQTQNRSGDLAFLTLVTPKKSFYVGELVPVEIRAYFRGDVAASLNGLPVISSDAFTMNKPDDKPRQSRELVGGQPYAVVTWMAALSAVKAGEYSLGLQLPVLVRVQERANSRRGGFFDDSFFEDFFGRTVEKPVTLASEPMAAKVLALPAENRPPDFKGAVGRFDVTAAATPAQVAAGDPLTLRVKITGSGNFDRVASDLLASSGDWKTYKSVARFEPEDNVGFQGTKTIEQAIVPTVAGKREVPGLKFSYFDPDTQQYVTRSTAAIPVEVTPGAVAALAPAPIQNPKSQIQNDLAPNRVEPGSFTRTLRPLLLTPWFLMVNLLAWLSVGATLLGLQRRKRRLRDPKRAQMRQAAAMIKEHLSAMESALHRADTVAFFDAARRALQHQLGALWDVPPETITIADINARLNGDAATLRPVFQLADQVAYSGERMNVVDLTQWQKIVTAQLNRLEKP